MSEQQYDFVGEEKKTGMAAAMHFIWNSEKKEFCGRNGASWAKVSFFYSIFYACLGAFFIGMLSVFFSNHASRQAYLLRLWEYHAPEGP